MPLAIIKGGHREGEMIYFDERNREGSLKIENLYDYIPDKEIRKQKKYMTTKEMLFLKDAFENNHIRDEVKSIYDNLRPTMEKEISKHVHINNGHFEIIPLIKENQVQKCFISGQSGSGKSTWISNYAQTYKKLFPNNSIYVISRHNEDPVLDKIKGIKRIKIDDRLISQPIDCEDLANSVAIFDDTDCIKNKGHKDALNALKNSILETGRHTRTSCLITSHLACKGSETRSILNEAHQIYFFIGSGMPINYLLQNYMGLEKKQIGELKKDNTRWHGFLRGYPQMVLTETTLRFLKDINN